MSSENAGKISFFTLLTENRPAPAMMIISRLAATPLRANQEMIPFTRRLFLLLDSSWWQAESSFGRGIAGTGIPGAGILGAGHSYFHALDRCFERRHANPVPGLQARRNEDTVVFEPQDFDLAKPQTILFVDN